MRPRIGSLCSGYGGLEMGVRAVIGGTVAWHVEYDADPSKILAHHWPDVPNHGDLTRIDWSPKGRRLAGIEPVDVLTAGYPCQPFSHAGKRKGSNDVRHLWPFVASAIRGLRPRLVVLENVRGHVSLGLDAVIGDLSGLGYDARWCVVRAADAGAPHGRARIFVVAHPVGERWEGLRPEPARRGSERSGPAAADTNSLRHERLRAARGRRHGPADGSLLPTPRATDGTKGGPNQRGSSGDLMLPSAVVLLPTPAVNDMGEGKTPDAWDAWTATMQDRHGNGNGHGKSLSIEALRLLPTPTSMDSHSSGGGYNGQTNVTLTDATVRQPERWGIYADAIARWERLTRPAPAPTMVSTKGTAQLAPAFSEWMQGLPEGHVTAVPGLSRNAMLKALGNGVVPQQAALALRLLLTDARAAA